MGLCFKCGDKYGLGHQCKRQLMKIERIDGGKEGEEEAIEGDGLQEEEEEEVQGEEGGEISFHALKGSSMGQIIKVRGQVGKQS